MKTGVYRAALRNTSTYFLATAARRFISFLLLPLYTRFLTPADYGALELLNLIYLLFSTLVGMQLSSSLCYFFFKAESTEAREEIVSNAFLGAAMLGCIAAALGWILAPWLSTAFFRNSSYAGGVRLILAGYAFMLPLETASAYLRALNRAGIYVSLTICQLLVQIGANILFIVHFRMGFMGALWGQFAAVAIFGTYLSYYALSQVRISFRFAVFTRFVRYSFPFTVGCFGMTLVHFGDRWFLPRYVSLADVGIYSLAYSFGMLIEYLLTPFAMYWNAQMFDIVRQPNGASLYARFCTYVALVLTFAAVMIAAFITPVLRVMVPPTFQQAAVFVPWLAVAYVLRAVDQHFRSAFRLEAKTGREARVMVLGGITCLLAYAALIPPLKLWGAVIATNLAFAAMLVYGFRQAQKVRWFPFEYRRLTQIGMTALVMILLSYLVRPAGFWQQVALAVALTGMFPAFLYITGFLLDEERDAIRGLSERVRGVRVRYALRHKA